MEAPQSIPKERTLPKSQDYDVLRAEGLQYIEQLAHSIWTDYNAHDPGITTLEALCYAITELGYRCNFDMADLLTDNNGNLVPGQTLFTAKQILPNNPLSVSDYRKLLIDLEGVHNAWLLSDDALKDKNGLPVPVNEVPLYANCKDDKLQYAPTKTALFLSGLYRVLIDLDEDNVYGDLNNGEVVIANPALAGKFAAGEFWFSIGLKPWKNADFVLAGKASQKTNISTAPVTEQQGKWICNVTLNDGSKIEFQIAISKKPASHEVTLADVQAMVVGGAFDWLAGVFVFYVKKITKARDYVKTAVKTLQDCRNLCEDFMQVTTIDDEEIAFCFDVDVKADFDIERVQAEMFYAIENYLNPSVDFYSLKEMLARKIPVDEIFEGVTLQHGFIDTAQLETTQLRTVIHTSDIVNLLMDIPGVIAIRNFLMTKYDTNGKAMPGFIGLKWCMTISDLHKPVLASDKSKIILFKNQFPFIANYNEVEDTVSLFHAQRSRAKLNGLEDDLPVPAGKTRDTESHWPLQYDFPATYGVGMDGLPKAAMPIRMAQQKQFKAYLMFYEQLLADFLSQLTHAHTLFSTNNLKQTYYAQFLDKIRDIDAIYVQNSGNPWLNDAISNPDSTAQPRNSWQDLYEPKHVFEDRRGRFLDHLLARFAESFNEYALVMYEINYVDRTEEKIEFDEITAAKIRALQSYPEISGNRGKAYNYFPQDDNFNVDNARLWDTYNVSGVEKRVALLTGITDFTRRYLSCIKNVEIECNEKEVTENGVVKLKCFHSFTMVSLTGVIFVSKEFENKSDANAALNTILTDGKDPANYKVSGSGPVTITVSDILTNVLDRGTVFNTVAQATNAISQIAAEFEGECNYPVGMHLIEHILLRPRPVQSPDKPFDPMQVCLHNCDCPCELDPYSFRVSVVLPYWPGHFDSMAFRQYFENKIREEAPAHISIKVCWLNNELLTEFERRYRQWIENLADYAFDPASNLDAFRDSNDQMVDMLTQLHSEYPQASLHNCTESKEGTNVVQLGRTVLGTYKNP